MCFSIRSARIADAARITEVETAADRMLVGRFAAQDWPAADDAAERFAHPGFLIVGVLDGSVVGFAHVLEVEGDAHLEQVSVTPAVARRGLGRMLVTAVMQEATVRGHRALTLRTYADVPWHAPFYARLGFAETEPATPFLRRLVQIERGLRLDVHGRRIQMTAQLPMAQYAASSATERDQPGA